MENSWRSEAGHVEVDRQWLVHANGAFRRPAGGSKVLKETGSKNVHRLFFRGLGYLSAGCQEGLVVFIKAGRVSFLHCGCQEVIWVFWQVVKLHFYNQPNLSAGWGMESEVCLSNPAVRTGSIMGYHWCMGGGIADGNWKGANLALMLIRDIIPFYHKSSGRPNWRALWRRCSLLPSG